MLHAFFETQMCLDALEQSRACRLSILGKTVAFSAQHIGPKSVTRINSLVTMCRQEQRQLMKLAFPTSDT
jgi:hypothetical protein